MINYSELFDTYRFTWIVETESYIRINNEKSFLTVLEAIYFWLYLELINSNLKLNILFKEKIIWTIVITSLKENTLDNYYKYVIAVHIRIWILLIKDYSNLKLYVLSNSDLIKQKTILNWNLI